MINLPTLAAGYFVGWCINTPQGRAFAGKALKEAMKHAGGVEGAILKKFVPGMKQPKKDENHDPV